MTVGPGSGATLTSDDGVLTVSIPAGAVAAPTEFSVQRIANTAPGIGTSYRLAPTGLAFAQLVTLTFRPSLAGMPVAGLSVMTRDPATGYWTAVQQNLVVDAAAGTLTVSVSTFAQSDWALVAAATARDFYGSFTLTENLEYPLSASGTANLAFAGASGSRSWFVVPGSIAITAPVPVGSATCMPSPASVPLPTSVAELDLGSSRFDFGISGRWDGAACSDGTPRTLTAVFDTLGANLVGCSRSFVGTPVVAADHLSGSMSVNCGSRGTATATWDFGTCPSVAGAACTPTFCHTAAAISCASGGPVCNDTAVAADGTACGTGGACVQGACSPCAAGTICVPSNPCHGGSLACSPAPSCTDTGAALPDGSSCGAGQACLSGTCAACVTGTDCVPANPCDVGSLSCSPSSSCIDTGLHRGDGTACGAGQACLSGTCAACVAGAACVPANPCHGGSLTCSPATSCSDTGAALPDGSSCGAGQACLSGTCAACVAGADCVPANPCHVGSLACSPTPSCVDAGVPRSDGTACGAGEACVAGTCGACVAGAACVPSNPCHGGSLVCSPATSCADTGALPDGSACGTGQACLAGICGACVAGAACVPSNPCHGGSLVCSPATSCADTGALPDGSGCGVGHACLSGACGACVAGAACVPSNPCHGGSLVCSPASSCTDTLVPVLNGTSCPAGQVCLAGACVPRQTIAGTRLATYWTDPPVGQTAPTLVTAPAPDIVSSPSPTARIADGAGGWVTYGAGGFFAPDGSFSIAGLPSGASYVVEYALPGGLLAWADASGATLDLGYDVLGRLSPPLAAPVLDTLVTFTLDAPWNASGDQVEMASSNADAWDVLVPSAPIVPGTPATFVENWRASATSSAPLHLLDAGDTLWLHQLATFTAAPPAASYLSAVAATSLTGVTLADGSPAAVGGTLLAAPASGAAAVDWDLPAFEAFLPNMLPPGAIATSSGHLLVVGATPYALASPAPPATAGSPELLVLPVATGSVPAGSRLALGSLSYGQFLPTWWPEWQRAAFTVRVDYLAPGATTPLSESTSVVREEPMSPAPPSPIVPAVSPVAAPAVATAAGGATISWTAPALPAGPPAPSYRVEVHWLRASGTASVSSAVLRYLTTSTQVAIPPGVLTAGETYYARITAELPGASGAAPFRRANAQSRASALTAPFVP